MSKAIIIMGEPGQGKTCALRTLNPAETYYIDADGKGISFDLNGKKYNAASKNYVRSDDAEKILTLMKNISEKRPDIKNVIVDTLNSIMIADEGRRRREKGYDKWVDLAWSVLDICTEASRLRDDLNVILIAHSQTESDDTSGEKFTRVLTSGKKLNKIGLEKYFNIIFLAKKKGDEYVLETQANNSTARTPFGVFSGDIPNDIAAAIKQLDEQ